jgi:hypothetical protein
LFFMAFVCVEDRQQATLLPERLDDWVPAEHVCRVIDAFVQRLPLAAPGFSQAEPKRTGRPLMIRATCSTSMAT